MEKVRKKLDRWKNHLIWPDHLAKLIFYFYYYLIFFKKICIHIYNLFLDKLTKLIFSTLVSQILKYFSMTNWQNLQLVSATFNEVEIFPWLLIKISNPFPEQINKICDIFSRSYDEIYTFFHAFNYCNSRLFSFCTFCITL